MLCWSYEYRTRANISCGLYIFYFIFHCGLYCRAVSITNNLCTKQENPQFIIKSGLKWRMYGSLQNCEINLNML
jgi:hypothetical protein